MNPTRPQLPLMRFPRAAWIVVPVLFGFFMATREVLRQRLGWASDESLGVIVAWSVLTYVDLGLIAFLLVRARRELARREPRPLVAVLQNIALVIAGATLHTALFEGARIVLAALDPSHPLAQYALGDIYRRRFVFWWKYGFVFNATTCAAILILDWAVERARHLGETRLRIAKLDEQLAHEELAAVRQKVPPRFLLSALAVLRRRVEVDPGEAERLLLRLSGWLRGTLDEELDGLTPLGQEVAFAARRLEIAEIASEGRLDVEVELAAETLDSPVPTGLLGLLIDDLVDFERLDRPGRQRLRIRARREDGELALELVSRCEPQRSFTARAAAERGARGTELAKRRLEHLGDRRGTISVEHVDDGATRIAVRIAELSRNPGRVPAGATNGGVVWSRS